MNDDKRQPDQLLPYKTTCQPELKLHVFTPENHTAEARCPGIVFFFGGGWVGGTPTHFYPQSRYLKTKGMVAICAEYRTRGSHETTPFECVEDGKSAIRWVRAHAGELGIDPKRIASGGGSAGGHVAACTGVIDGYDCPTEDLTVSSVPNAMVLFNPVVDTTPFGFGSREFHDDEQTALSPCHHVRPGLPPTIVFHGTGDKTVPYEGAEDFNRKMNGVGNPCRLLPYPDRPHGFFNGNGSYSESGNPDFDSTLREMDAFLTGLGWI